jgi:hypothetical protein
MTISTTCPLQEGSRAPDSKPFLCLFRDSSPSTRITGMVTPVVGKSSLTKAESFSYQPKRPRTRTFSTRVRRTVSGVSHPRKQILRIRHYPTRGDWTRQPRAKALGPSLTVTACGPVVAVPPPLPPPKQRLGDQARGNLPEPRTLHSRLASAYSRTVEEAG